MNIKASSNRGLLIAGVVLTALFAVITWLSGDFEPDDPLKKRPVIAVVAIFSVAFCVYIFSVYRFTSRPSARRIPSNSQSQSNAFSSTSVPIIIGIAIAMRVVGLFSTPILEIDLYRYIWDGNATVAGVSPYDFSPQQVLEAAKLQPDQSPPGNANPNLRRLADLSTSSESLHSVLSTIHFGYLPSPYPPVSQLVFAVSAALTPDQASVETHLLVMRFLIVLFDLGSLWVLLVILRTLKLPLEWAIAYGWCPLVFKEFANSGHLDSITVFFTLLAAYTLLRQGRWAIPVSACFLAVATAGKFYPIVLMPVFFVAWIRLPEKTESTSALTTRWRQGFVGTLAYTVTVLALLYPMLRESTSTNELVSGANRSDGLHVFIRYFEMNDFLFMLTIENLKSEDLVLASRPAWFVVMPEETRATIVATGEAWNIPREEVPFRIARLLSVLVYGLVIIWLCWQLWNRRTFDSFLFGCFGSVAWVWFLSPTLNPWYWTWALVFIPFAVRREWLWISGLTMIYYLRFWFEYHYTGVSVFGTGYQGTEFFDYVVTCLEFGPWFACFVLLSLYRWKKPARDLIFRNRRLRW